MSDLAVKEDTLRSAIDVLPSALLTFKQEYRYAALRELVEKAIMEAPGFEARPLQQFAADKLEEELEKKGVDAAPIARTFLAMMKRDMGME